MYLLSRKAMKGDRLQQGRRKGTEVTQKGKINREMDTEREITVRMVNLTEHARDTCLHCFCSFPWRVPHCSIFKAILLKGPCSVLLASYGVSLQRWTKGQGGLSAVPQVTCLNVSHASGFRKVPNSQAVKACSLQLLRALLLSFISVLRSEC